MFVTVDSVGVVLTFVLVAGWERAPYWKNKQVYLMKKKKLGYRLITVESLSCSALNTCVVVDLCLVSTVILFLGFS